jgi:signal transduction histidine kinase
VKFAGTACQELRLQPLRGAPHRQSPTRPLPPSGSVRTSATSGRRRPIRLLTHFSVLLAAAILAGTAATVWQLHTKALADSQRELSTVSIAIAEQTARMIQGIDLVLTGIIDDLRQEQIASSADYRRLNAAQAVHTSLREKISGLPQLDAVTMIGADGGLINFSRYWPIPAVNVADREYFAFLRDHPSPKPFVSAPVPNRGTGTWTIYLARRVDGPEGNFIGLVLGAIELRYFEDFYTAIGLGEGDAISLWRRDGVMLARYPRLPMETIGKPFAVKAITDVLPQADSGVFRSVGPMDGVARIVSTRALRDYPLFVNVTRTEAAAFADWRQQAFLIGGSGLFGATALALLTWALVRQFAADERAEMARSAAEEAERRREQAEAASRAKSAFLANMSHELRTPLNAIIGFSELFLATAFGPLGSKYSEHAADIHSAGRHLLRIINDILDLARVEADAIPLDIEPVDIDAVAQNVQRMLEGGAAKANVHISVDLSPFLPAVLTDEKRLSQILLNVTSNAIKFTPAGGAVRISGVAGNDRLILQVIDTGIGIAPEDIATVMAPFGQVDTSLARKYAGTGLGLPLAKRLVEALGGSLSLESEIGNGTTVTINLPLHVDAHVLAENPSGS